jgi:hypothetical protein
MEIKMRPYLNDNRLLVEYSKTDRKKLLAARAIGNTLVAIYQAEGQKLVDAIDAILSPPEVVQAEGQAVVDAVAAIFYPPATTDEPTNPHSVCFDQFRDDEGGVL